MKELEKELKEAKQRAEEPTKIGLKFIRSPDGECLRDFLKAAREVK